MGESDEKKFSIIHIDAGDLAKPASLLIEKISDAIGGIAKPWQLRRVAEAEVAAERIRATGEVKITELHRRAARRFIMEEAKKQNNMEGIIVKALPDVTEGAKPEQLEDDWITNFFDKCRLVSDEEMQALWAKILSGEVNSPGKFSKRTIDLVSGLDKSDALSFSTLCNFNFSIAPGDQFPLIYDKDSKIYTENGVFFSLLAHLESIGLIHFGEVTGYVRRGLGQSGYLYYFGQKVWIEFAKPNDNELQLGHVILTRAGLQLASICISHPQEGFVEYVKEKWRGFGYKTEPPPHPNPTP